MGAKGSNKWPCHIYLKINVYFVDIGRHQSDRFVIDTLFLILDGNRSNMVSIYVFIQIS